MVDTIRICSRNGCREGDLDPDGNEVTFNLKNKFGVNYKSCDRCRERDIMHRNKHVLKAEAAVRMKVNVKECVYCIRKGKEIVYIGSSDSAGWRLYEHFHKGSKHSVLGRNGINVFTRNLEYSWDILWHGGNMNDAMHQEKLLIQLHQPKFNKIKYITYNG